MRTLLRNPDTYGWSAVASLCIALAALVSNHLPLALGATVALMALLIAALLNKNNF